MTMRRITFIGSILCVVALMGSCVNNSPKKVDNSEKVAEDSIDVNDSTLYGVCGEGTAMHTLELITDDGLSHSYMINLDDSISGVQGGLLTGDRLAVITSVEYGDTFAIKVINLTTLLGKWVSLDKNFEIKEGGSVKSVMESETRPWTSWAICNGHLVFNSDTFDVAELGADSMFLENRHGIYGFKRVK